jgi:hypothetical protein
MSPADPNRLLRRLPSMGDALRSEGGRPLLAPTAERDRRSRGSVLERRAELGALPKVHRGSLQGGGFAEEVTTAALAAAGHSRKISFMVDLGSGALVDLGRRGRTGEPSVSPKSASPGAAKDQRPRGPGFRALSPATVAGAIPATVEAPAGAFSLATPGADELAARLARADSPFALRTPERERLQDAPTFDDAELDDVAAAVDAASDVARGGTLAC